MRHSLRLLGQQSGPSWSAVSLLLAYFTFTKGTLHEPRAVLNYQLLECSKPALASFKEGPMLTNYYDVIQRQLCAATIGWSNQDIGKEFS